MDIATYRQIYLGAHLVKVNKYVKLDGQTILKEFHVYAALVSATLLPKSQKCPKFSIVEEIVRVDLSSSFSKILCLQFIVWAITVFPLKPLQLSHIKKQSELC